MNSSDYLLKLGQQQYKLNNYHHALNFFDSILAYEKAPDISLLDSRAATYEKLGDLQAALKDGRRMISNYKQRSDGYLRTGKILKLLDKYSVARNIYKYGIRNVPTSDPKSQLLREMLESLIPTDGSPKARDPLTVLPPELLEMVFSHLDFRHIV
ncbi:MAG: hypothetical protein Q9220_002514 [cf. Caloplaca sp. 1 TL-2023]